MAKRKSNAVEKRQKRLREESDAQLASGLFSKKTVGEDSWENEEQDYELVPRNLKSENKVEGLPIKKDGVVKRVLRDVIEKESKEDSESENKESAPKSEGTKEDDTEAKTEQDEDANLSPQEKLVKIKEQIADYASRLIEDPEENISCLTKLRRLAESDDFASSQLAILALVPVFKSLAPAYKIRPLTETEKKERVGKDIARLRGFEQGLVLNYQHYIELLTKLARVSASASKSSKKITASQVKQGQVATKAACELCLSSLRHFNFRAELFTIPIRRLNKKPQDETDLQLFFSCIRTLESLLKEDKDHGSISFDITRIMCKVIKDKNFRVDEAVVNVLLSLSLLDDYDPNGTKDLEPVQKMKKKNRVHLSKKQRKQRKELKEIEQEMAKAEQAITAEEREKFQAQTLKLLLTFYLEILKAGSYSADEKNDANNLMAAVLEGLSRFGQMANFDLLGDFLVVLKETMANIVEEHSLESNKFGIADNEFESGGIYTSEEIRKVLLCIVAAFALVTNHREVGRLPISVDFSKFVSTLYQIIADVCLDADLEFSHKSLRLADPLDATNATYKPAVNVSTKAELLLKSLDFIFFRSRTGSLARALPFIKRLYISSLQTPEKTTIATLKFIGKLLARYGEGLKGLWSTEDRITGEGNYILGIEKEDFEVDMERSNISSAVLWENVLLDKHFCPIIKDGSRSLMKNSKDSKSR
ncbi:putative nucleolar complex-associated protein [Clavispora lusitaniae]|uniref:Nucleolar complex-associated protein n=1 Tax=Clavispora lusitaniae TaxID=36911 RepID=A0ACD0WPF1_CLALS|nr:CBF/Mak21 family protein [Clavispora lusitaniae]QFZ29352.1 putative nucleolar complex-associated protein [Clavispora lusitaniae]QFZ35015.1 putative nucleolar complex-associated protein [Clavispora lusitaniae]QFZ40700.1 putative nucleolar complex-associated protein [Clavispora lusitaniae]QFZ46380.1 putative nucleolar complex-associated protein [Clavispora lusitaniae]